MEHKQNLKNSNFKVFNSKFYVYIHVTTTRNKTEKTPNFQNGSFMLHLSQYSKDNHYSNYYIDQFYLFLSFIWMEIYTLTSNWLFMQRIVFVRYNHTVCYQQFVSF